MVTPTPCRLTKFLLECCGIFLCFSSTHFQGVGRKGLLPNAIADEEYYEEEYYDEYYDDEYYYYDDYWEDEDEERKEEKIEVSKFNEATVLENILDILKQGMGPMMGGGKDVRKGSETGGSQDFQSFHQNEKGVIGGYRTGYRWVLDDASD